MSNLCDRQHDAFANPAKMACREGNLRVLRQAAAGFVGVLGAFEVYRGSVRGHRMANLRVILR
jgi:hypothetical protein